jgi:transposase-like protein
MERTNVAEAARRLGVSQDAIYKRIKRGTIPWEKGTDDKTYVWIEEEDASTDGPIPSSETSYDPSTASSTDRLLDELRDRVHFLEAELADRKDEARRKDSIIMALTQRVPELEASSEPRESPQTPSGQQEKGTGPADDAQVQNPSWWRRVFLGEQRRGPVDG